MLHVKRQRSLVIVIVFCLSSFGFTQDKPPAAQLSPVEDLAAALVAAETDEECMALLAAKKELVKVELRQALIRQGEESLSKKNFSKALTIYTLAQNVAEQISDRTGVSLALNRIGTVYTQQGNYARAMEHFQKSLSISEALGDKASIYGRLMNIGNIYRLQGDYTQALTYFRRGLELSEELNDKAGIIAGLEGIGIIYRAQGNYERALEHYQKSLVISEASANNQRIAAILNNIGNIYNSQSNFARALEYYQKSLAISEALADKLTIAATLNNIGNIYNLQGNYNQALDHYQKSLALGDTGDKAGTANTLNNIGNSYLAQNNYSQANEYYQKSLVLRESLGDKAGIASSLNNIGSMHRLQGNLDQALEYYQKSLALREAIGDKVGIAGVLRYIAVVYNSQGNNRQAIEAAERATSIARQTGSLRELWQARAAAGKAYRKLNESSQAREAFEEAIATIETLRTQVAGSEQQQQRFFESKTAPYHDMAELLIAQDRAGEALAYAERAKARVLLDILSSGRAKINRSMTAQEKEQEQQLSGELVFLNNSILRENLRQKPDATITTDLKARLQRARLDGEAFQTNLYSSHPELKVQRGEVEIVNLEEAGNLLADAESALLEYMVTDEKTYLFVLTKNGSGNSALPDLRVYLLEIKERDLNERIESFRKQCASRDPGFREAAAQMYDLLLKPARAQLRGKTDLVIVPDLALWELPFQALQTAENRYLLEEYTISYTPSLTVLREIVKSRKRSTADPTVLALGNPSLGKQTVERSRMAQRDKELGPLPEAEREAVILGRLYGTGKSRVYVGAEASEEHVKAEASKFGILHFATHGIINNTSPMYSHVLLSQVNDNANEDGLLEAWEIMNLELKADLVVLSACETARGRVGAGEGVLGFTWGLFVAGCPTAVVSQWKVDSASTTKLMIEFHRNLKLRITKGEALKRAALKLLRNNEYRHPFYWAGFVLVGDRF
jgi:CHAT domain-containing protein